MSADMRSQRLREALPAEFASDQRREHHFRHSRQRRQQTNGRERLPQHRSHQPGDQRDQRRLVHISPVQMPAARQIVQLVDEIAVVPARVKDAQELAGGNGKHDRARSYVLERVFQLTR